jgi:hypothetical protein
MSTIINGIGRVGIRIAPPSGGGYTTRTAAFAAATGIADTTILNALNTFDTGLISNGLDTKMKALYPFVGGTATTHKYNFMNALDTNGAFRLQFNGGWTHNNNGVTGNGTNAYADTFLNPSIQLNPISSHFSYYDRTTANDSGILVGGGGTLDLFMQNSSGTVYANMSNGAYMQQSVASNAKFYMVNRNAYSYQEIRTNNSVLTSNTSNSNTLPNFNILLNSYTSTSSFSIANCAFSSMGDGMTNSEAIIFYNLIQAMQTTLSRQV